MGTANFSRKFAYKSEEMSENELFKKLLTTAAKSAKRKASRKKLPIAISENGEIKLIYPDKKVVVLRKKARFKKAS